MSEFLQTIGALTLVFGGVFVLWLAIMLVPLWIGRRRQDDDLDRLIKFFEDNPFPLVHAEKAGVLGWYDPCDVAINVVPLRGSGSPESN